MINKQYVGPGASWPAADDHNQSMGSKLDREISWQYRLSDIRFKIWLRVLEISWMKVIEVWGTELIT